jgi:hypothetical protein
MGTQGPLARGALLFGTRRLGSAPGAQSLAQLNRQLPLRLRHFAPELLRSAMANQRYAVGRSCGVHNPAE